MYLAQITFPKFTILLSLIILVSACTTSKYSAANRSYRKQAKAYATLIRKEPSDINHTATSWTGTTNFSLRRPNFVIIHHTAQNSCEQTLNTFTNVKTEVSAHYVICRDGIIHHMLSDNLRAWHAGGSRWGNLTDLNSASIGIELDNNGFESFAEPQINSLLTLLSSLKKTHTIPAANFIGHGDIAPTRKVDPNVTFPWKRLSENGFGLWYDDIADVQVPENFSVKQALRIIGYDMADSAAAMQGFKRHWMQDTMKTFNLTDRKALYNLSGKFQ